MEQGASFPSVLHACQYRWGGYKVACLYTPLQLHISDSLFFGKAKIQLYSTVQKLIFEDDLKNNEMNSFYLKEKY